MKDLDKVNLHKGNISLAGRPDFRVNSLVDNFRFSNHPTPLYSGLEEPTPAPPPPPPPPTYSVDFDGINEYMDAGTSSDYSIVGGGSISYWIYPSFTTSTYTESVGKRSTAGFQITHTLTGGGSGMNISVFNHAFSASSPTVSISTQNQWYLLTLVFQSGGGATLYLNDGSSGASGTGSTSAKPSYSFTEDATAPLYIARHPTSLTRCFTGLIDEVSIFSSELSASDVETIYNSGTAYDLSSYSPVSWWRMGDNDGGTGTTITNQGSGGNNGTLTNGPTFSTDVPS